MKYVDEYRDPEAARQYVASIRSIVTKPWTIMEICGGQTHSIVKYGIDELLPKQVTLVHGPGCPVCVTPVELIDKALQIASCPDVIFCSFGDMLRVPGSSTVTSQGTDLLSVKAGGGDVRIVYSPMDAVHIAQQNPAKQVVFFAVGFETTAPANAMSVYYASQHNVTNYSILVSHVLVPPAMEAILGSPANRVQGFLAAGHVCTVMGYTEYYPIAAKYRVPIVVTGFEPLDLLQGIYMCVKQLEEGRFEVENQYARAVRREGNAPAQQLVAKVFCVVDRKWRGVGGIPTKRIGTGAGIRGLRCRFSLRPFGIHGAGRARLHQRIDHARCEEAGGVFRLRQAMHARPSTGCANGFVRRRVRGLLPVSPLANRGSPYLGRRPWLKSKNSNCNAQYR